MSIMFTGSFVALITPMQVNGAIDFTALDTLIDFHLAHHTDGLVILGTTGEASTIDKNEYNQIISRVLKRVNKKIPVIAGIGKNDTAATVLLAKLTTDLGVDGLLIVTPYYNRPTQEGLYRHYRTIADAVHIPQILYNVPSRTGCDLLPETVNRLVKVPHIIGIKETVGIERTKQLLQQCGEIAIYCGDDVNNLPMLKAGACGFISVTANVAPQALHDLYTAFVAGKLLLAEKIDAELNLLNENLFLEANPIPVKWAAAQLGLVKDVLRLPLTSLSTKYHGAVKAAMQAAKLG